MKFKALTNGSTRGADGRLYVYKTGQEIEAPSGNFDHVGEGEIERPKRKAKAKAKDVESDE